MQIQQKETKKKNNGSIKKNQWNAEQQVKGLVFMILFSHLIFLHSAQYYWSLLQAL